MKAIRTILACIRKADQTYNLFNHGDKVILGLSGGKDSIALLYCLNLYKKFSHTNFVVQPVFLDLGFGNPHIEEMKSFCKNLGYDLLVEDCKDVYKILKIQQERQSLSHLPCSICSKMKKAAINNVAKRLNFNKVAFAHHVDDALETLFMNMIYGARFATFSPKMELKRVGLVFIRPFAKVHEKDIVRLMKEENLTIFPSNCPADKKTSREDIKLLLNNIKKQYPSSEDNFVSALNNYQQLDLWGNEIYYQINQKGLTLKPVITSKDKFYEMTIRNEVFIKEQNINPKFEYVEDDEFQAESFLIMLNDKPIGCIRYIKSEKEILIQRFAILKKYRNKGYGKLTLGFLIDFLKTKYTPTTLIIKSQYQARYFYEKLGFKTIDKPFIKAKIKHVKMTKDV